MAADEAPATRISFGDFTIDRADERLIGPHGPVRIGNKAFQVLSMLVEQEGRLLTKDALFSSVWDGMLVSESSLTSVIKELRRALGDDTKTPQYIESVYGRGYRLIAAVNGNGACIEASISALKPRPERPAAAADQASRGGPPLVLVSRFQDEAVRASHPYCADELREEVLSGLARVREIRLVADDRLPQDDRGGGDREHGYQLSATLLPSREGVKVIARAKRLQDGVIVWADTMVLSGGGGTALGVETIVRRIVGAALPAVDEDMLVGLPTEPGDLYDAYLVAKRRSFTAANFEESSSAREALERIIAERPDFGLAYPPLVRLYNTDFGYTALGSTGSEERAHALQLAKRGLAADRANAHAHSVLGWCYLWHEERGLARRSFEQALALNPYNPVRVQEAATAWTYLGDLDGAREYLDRAAELNPNLDDAYFEDEGRLKLIEGDYAGARASLEAVAKGQIWVELYLGTCELELGIAAGRDRVQAWRERVEQCWHSHQTPSDADLLAWFRRHHLLPDLVGANFFAVIEKALAG